MSKAYKKSKGLKNLVYSLFTLLLVLLALLLVGVRLVGITPYSVMSGSMASTYPVGSLIYVRQVDTDQLSPGDVITFVLDQDLTLVTHRISRIDPDRKLFYTKGDSNNSEDFAPVLAENIVGSPLFYLPLLGYFSYFISRPPGIYILLVLALTVFIFLVYDLIYPKNQIS